MVNEKYDYARSAALFIDSLLRDGFRVECETGIVTSVRIDDDWIGLLTDGETTELYWSYAPNDPDLDIDVQREYLGRTVIVSRPINVNWENMTHE